MAIVALYKVRWSPQRSFRGFKDLAAKMRPATVLNSTSPSPGVYNAERDTGNKLHDILSIFVFATPVSTNLIAYMSDRCMKVLEKHGGPTGY